MGGKHLSVGIKRSHLGNGGHLAGIPATHSLSTTRMCYCYNAIAITREFASIIPNVIEPNVISFATGYKDRDSWTQKHREKYTLLCYPTALSFSFIFLSCKQGGRWLMTTFFKILSSVSFSFSFLNLLVSMINCKGSTKWIYSLSFCMFSSFRNGF